MSVKSEKGVSLIIIFLTMTVMIAMVLNLSLILFKEIRLISGIGDYLSSFYAADTGMEKTLYFERKQIPNGGTTGFCNVCAVCASTTNDCTACAYTGSDCVATSCHSCHLSYTSVFPDINKHYTVDATIIGDPQNNAQFITFIDAKGFYKDITRQISSTDGSSKSFTLDPNLIGYWNFDEAVPGTFADTSGSSNTGTGHGPSGANNTPQPSNTVAPLTFSNFKSASFDSTDDYVDVGNAASLNLSQITFSAWIRTASFPNDFNIIASKWSYWGGNPNNEWHFSIRGGKLNLYTSDIGNFYANTTVTLNQWHHVAFTIDATTTTLYLDGVADGSTAGGLTAGTSRIAIGDPGSGRNINNIDDVRIYNRPLSASEIADLALTDTGPGPVAYWKLDESSGASAADSSGNGNIGSLINSPSWSPTVAPTNFGNTHSLSFANSNDYVAFNTTNYPDISAALWFRSTTFSGNHVIAGNMTDPNPFFGITGSNTIISVRTANGVLNNFTVPAMSVGTWYHLAVVRTSNVLHVYLNGVESSTGAIIDNGAFQLNEFGGYPATPTGLGWSGLLDDFHIYNRALTLPEVANLAAGN